MPEVQRQWLHLTDLLVGAYAKPAGVILGLRLAGKEAAAEVSDGGHGRFAMEFFE
ncbi:hypothetical protein PMm318_A04250 [Pseudomonas moorei]